MNAPLRIAVYGAGAVFGLALALNAAVAQDQEPAATTTALGQEPAQQPVSQPKAKAPRAELNTSIAKLTRFEDFDKNKDGSIAKEEIPLNDQLSLNFSSYDGNSDSKLSKEEFAKYNGGAKTQVARTKTDKAKKQSQPGQQ